MKVIDSEFESFRVDSLGYRHGRTVRRSVTAKERGGYNGSHVYRIMLRS